MCPFTGLLALLSCAGYFTVNGKRGGFGGNLALCEAGRRALLGAVAGRLPLDDDTEGRVIAMPGQWQQGQLPPPLAHAT